jgi:transposase
LGLVSGFCADKALRQIEKAADGLFHSETPTSAKVPDPRDRPIVPAHLTTESLDIAKCVFQVHGADAAGHVLFRKRVTRAKLLGFPAAQNASRWKPVPAPIIGRARSASWAIACDWSSAYVKPFVKRQKNDAADAEAICEAGQRPSMRFTEEKQANGIVFRARDLL